MTAPVKSNVQQIMELLAQQWLGVSVPNLFGSDGHTPMTITHVNAYVSSRESATALPFVVIEPSGGPVDPRATHMLRANDKFKCYLCLAKQDSGLDLKDILEMSLYWRDPVFIYFSGMLRLGGSLPFLTIIYISSWDVKLYHSGDVDYLSILFEFTCREDWPVTIGV